MSPSSHPTPAPPGTAPRAASPGAGDAPASDAFLQGLPKVELHLHLEGTLQPAMMLDLARRNGVAIAYGDVAEIEAAYRFTDLQSFLDIYYAGASVLQTRADFRDLTLAYLDSAAADRVAHVEVFFDPQTHTDRGIAFDTVLDGIWDGLQQGQARHGITAHLILCFLRHLSEAAAEATLDEALAHRDRILGIGLDSSERGHPPEKFARVFARARAAGFRVTAHAGEEGPPDYVRQALDILQVERIDHGNRALEDPALTARLAALGMALTVCPLSNLALRGVARLEDHPLRRMLQAGLKASVHSDDPAYFGGSIAANYRAVRDALGLSAAEVARLAQNAVDAAWVDQPRRATLQAALDAHLASHGVQPMARPPA